MLSIQTGDEARLVAPSSCLDGFDETKQNRLRANIAELGLTLTFAKNALLPADHFNSTPIATRVDDLMAAYADKKVKLIIAVRGGYNCEEMLDHLDYDVIRNNPKPLLGFSDITALHNAIYARTGIVQLSGPGGSTLSKPWIEQDNSFTLRALQQICMKGECEVVASRRWTDDRHSTDLMPTAWRDNSGLIVLQNGQATGRIVGGNMCTLQLLIGTPYMPPLKDSILFIEEASVQEGDFNCTLQCFMRDLGQLLRQPDAQHIRGIVIGRFPSAANVTRAQLDDMISRHHTQLKDMPIIYGADFGHTFPMITLPIGGTADVRTNSNGLVTIKLKTKPFIA